MGHEIESEIWHTFDLLGHSGWARSGQVTKSKARLERAKKQEKKKQSTLAFELVTRIDPAQTDWLHAGQYCAQPRFRSRDLVH